MTKIKICGITNIDDALAATGYGADALGFIFYDKSPRCIKPDLVRMVSQDLPPYLKKVGVFVNEGIDQVRTIVDMAQLDIVQFSGDENAEYCNQYDGPYIKTFRVKDNDSISGIDEFNTNYFLLDSFKDDEYGGTGKLFNWGLIEDKEFRNKYVILSGGLDPQNVGDAVSKIRPYAVDVASGVESEPGKKDHDKLRKFIEAVKNAS